MHLTLHSDYALRVLIALAVAPGRRSTIGSIAERYAISRNHLVKVCHRLQKLGYVEGIRGKGGGLRLAREPGDIRLGDVLRAMEPGFDLVECFGEANHCVITRACGLQGILGRRAGLFESRGHVVSVAALMRLESGLPDVEPPVPQKRRGPARTARTIGAALRKLKRKQPHSQLSSSGRQPRCGDIGGKSPPAFFSFVARTRYALPALAGKAFFDAGGGAGCFISTVTLSSAMDLRRSITLCRAASRSGRRGRGTRPGRPGRRPRRSRRTGRAAPRSPAAR